MLYKGPSATWAAWASFLAQPAFAILLCARRGMITEAVFPPPSIYSACGVTLIFTSHLLAALPFALAISPSLPHFFWRLCLVS
jgi:hypothetical protein